MVIFKCCDVAVAPVCLAMGVKYFANVMIPTYLLGFMVGMVLAPTCILLCLGSICLCASLEFSYQTLLRSWWISHYLLH